MDDIPAPSFPKVRQGYDRGSVDSHLHRLNERIDALSSELAAKAEEMEQLSASFVEVQTRYQRLASASLDERAQDVLDAAGERAQAILARASRAADDLLARAEREAEILEERARQEIAWHRRQLRAEREELVQQQSAMRTQLSSFRAVLASETADGFPELAERGELAHGDALVGRVSMPASEHHSR
jgi:cell division septum initiation protein DivIVA